jgi:hypothetical protein
MGRTTDPVEKSSSSGQLNWSKLSEGSGRSEEGSSASGLALEVTLRAARFAYNQSAPRSRGDENCAVPPEIGNWSKLQPACVGAMST